MWKQRIRIFLKYRECEVVTTRVKTETDSEGSEGNKYNL